MTVFGREIKSTPWRFALWRPQDGPRLVAAIEGADVVINLIGRSVNCRYFPKAREEILLSRVESTEAVGRAIAAAKNRPKLWLQASTATIYAHRYDAANDEDTGVIGGSEPDVPEAWQFSVDVAKAWESALENAETPCTRKVAMRSAMIMSPDEGGIFDTLLGLVRRGLGGTAGDGRQYVSWIHEKDFVRAVDWLIEQDHLEGAINLAAPYPLPNEQFFAVLRRAAGFPFGLPAAEWMLEVGAFFMRTETELILKSRRVVPGRLLADGFQFEFPSWEAAADELCRRPRAEAKPRP